MTKKYKVLSPDGFDIRHDITIYRSMKQARLALKEWIQNYSHQGYYSQTCYNGYRRQISLQELADYCEIITI